MMLDFYLGGAAITAFYLYGLNVPRAFGDWLAWAAFVIAWPLVFVALVVDLVRSRK